MTARLNHIPAVGWRIQSDFCKLFLDSARERREKERDGEKAVRIVSSQGITLPSTSAAFTARLALPSAKLTWLLPLCSRRHNPNPITGKLCRARFCLSLHRTLLIFTSAQSPLPLAHTPPLIGGFKSL